VFEMSLNEEKFYSTSTPLYKGWWSCKKRRI